MLEDLKLMSKLPVLICDDCEQELRPIFITHENNKPANVQFQCGCNHITIKNYNSLMIENIAKKEVIRNSRKK
jgi:hypothetical protein